MTLAASSDTNQKLLTLAVFTCEAYRELWEWNLKLLKANFPLLNQCEVLLVTDRKPSKPFESPTLSKILWPTDPDDFLEKLGLVLANCTSDRFLFLLDDYFFTDPIGEPTLRNLLGFAKETDANYLKTNIKSRIRLGKRMKYDGRSYATLKTKKPYAVDLYPCFWKTEFVRAVIDNWPFEEHSIWDFEGKFNRLSDVMPLEKCFCYCEKDFPFEDVVRKGKIIRHAHKKITADYGVDLTSWRPLMTRWEAFKDKAIPFTSRLIPNRLKSWLKRHVFRKKRYYS